MTGTLRPGGTFIGNYALWVNGTQGGQSEELHAYILDAAHWRLAGCAH